MKNSNVILQPAGDAENEILVALLKDALSSEPTRRAMLADNRLTVYTAHQDSEVIGVIVLHWGDESKIELLAVNAACRGQGIGQMIVATILEEARRRGVKRILVGTGNFSLDNIAFYQKCGFRMSHIRRSYFDDVQPPEVWQGIKLRDMIVLDYIF